jgi:hypothetical protein
MAKAKFSFGAFEDTLRGTGLRSAQQQRYPSGGDVIQYDEATLTATSNPSNYSMRARYRRDNDTFQMWFRIALSGTPTNVSSTAPWAWAVNDTIGGYISAIIDRSV